MHSLRSDVETVDPNLVSLAISEIDISQYTEVAILTLLVYDTIITMDKEIKYFWSSPRKFVSLIYFANRYIGILGVLSGIVCKMATDTSFIEDWMTIILIDYILLMRVLALYHQDKRLAACLRTLFGLEAAFDLGLLIYGNIYEESKNIYPSYICRDNRNPAKVWAALSWLVLVFLGKATPMVFAIILMTLALYKAVEHWRETAGFSQFTLVKVLIQDQAIYFIMVIFCSVIEIMAPQLNVIIPLLANLLTILGSTSFLCVLGSHLLVHLKEAGERGANGGTSYRMTTMSNVEFS
ncbi:hypothetical protein DFH11DRAFT_1515944 [Phellopilus nigrolimitatus]|nr:hypothetical protein DFH11DRAFT_1515944 [Phellopilus nigrolimitatus]